MKTKQFVLTAILLSLSAATHAAPFGTAFTYQGRLTDGTNPANGSYDMTFALFDASFGANQLGFWEELEVSVENGLFTVYLDFGGSAFNGQARWLQISVRPDQDGTGPYTTLVPRQQLLPTPYALLAAAVPIGAIASNMLADGAVTASKLAANSVTSAALADSIVLGATNINGRLDVYGTSIGTPAISLFGGINALRVFADDGREKVSLDAGPGWGEFELNNDLPTNERAVLLSANRRNGGALSLNDTNGQLQAFLFGANEGGQLRLFQPNGNPGVIASNHQISTYGSDGQEQIRLWGPTFGEVLLNNGLANNANAVQLSANSSAGGSLSLNNTNGSTRARLSGANAGGNLQLHNGSGALSVDVRSQFSAGNTAAWVGLNDGGSERISFAARNGSTGQGGLIGVRNGSAGATVLITGDTGSGNSKLAMLNASGQETVQIHSDSGGEGRVLTEALEVTGRLRVPGAGDGTSTPVFVHVATAGNISGAATIITHPLTDGDPNAILIVTPRLFNVHSGIAVQYLSGKWHIFHADGSVAMSGERFNVLVVKP